MSLSISFFAPESVYLKKLKNVITGDKVISGDSEYYR